MQAVPTRVERQAQTRSDLVDAAERLFIRQGFHPTSVDAVAAEAGYTKGAVYSNFASKEDLFLAVYERRVDARVAEIEALLETAPTAREGLELVVPGNRGRRETEDGWMAVFFEFWAHALRHAGLRERFAAQHRRVIEPLARAAVALAEEDGTELPDDPRKLATARYAMQLGLQLERLTQPDVVDDELGLRMSRLGSGLAFEHLGARMQDLTPEGGKDGLPDGTPEGLRTRTPREQGSTRA